MNTLSNLFVGLCAFLHLFFVVLEMYLWTKPFGLKLFRQTPELAKTTAILAANQGLYNGFLAAGLIWSLCQPDPVFSYQLKLFFLGCVIVAGVFGAATFSFRILFAQTIPALLALIFVLLAK